MCLRVYVYWKDGEFDPDPQPAAGNLSDSRCRDNTAASDCRGWDPGKNNKTKNRDFHSTINRKTAASTALTELREKLRA